MGVVTFYRWSQSTWLVETNINNMWMERRKYSLYWAIIIQICHTEMFISLILRNSRKTTKMQHTNFIHINNSWVSRKCLDKDHDLNIHINIFKHIFKCQKLVLGSIRYKNINIFNTEELNNQILINKLLHFHLYILFHYNVSLYNHLLIKCFLFNWMHANSEILLIRSPYIGLK